MTEEEVEEMLERRMKVNEMMATILEEMQKQNAKPKGAKDNESTIRP